MNGQKNWRKRVNSSLAAVTVGLLAVSGVALAPSAAFAAEETVESGTLSWGFLGSWRNYVTGSIGNGTVAAISPATMSGETVDYVNGAGTIDLEASTGTITYEGGMQSLGHNGSGPDGTWGLNQTIVNPEITVTSATTGTLSLVVTQGAYGGFPARDGVREVIADLSFADGDLDDGSVTANATMTTAGSVVYGSANANYNPGATLDPVSFSFDLEAPAPAEETTTVLGTLPGQVLEGETVDLSATVAPDTAAGTVTFKNNGTALAAATDIAVADGVAEAADIVLPSGANSIVAEFSPADAAAFGASASAAQTVQVNATPAIATTSSIVAPEALVKVGDAVSISATVAADDATVPAGSFEFFALPSAAEPAISLGTEAVNASGAAEFTTSTLDAGGYSLKAVFTPENATVYAASEVVATAGTVARPSAFYLSVVDTTAPSAYKPGDSAKTSEGATASWGWSAYSDGWTKVADAENIVLGADGETFELSNGTVLADAGGAVISFTGTFRTQAYESFFPEDGQWIELVDPALHLEADGSGVWVAGVNTGISTYAANADAPRMVVDVVDNFTGGNAGVDAARDVTFAYADTTADGTWSAGRTSAWPNEFILAVPSAIRSFYYASGAGGDANKLPANLSVDFDWPAVTTKTKTTLTVSPAKTAVQGSKVTLKAAVTPKSATGTVTFFDGKKKLGSAHKLASGSASISVADLAVGSHDLKVEFEPADKKAYLPSTGSVAGFKVTKKETVVPTPKPTPTVKFTDIKKGDKFFKEISWMATEGISTGVKQANGTYKFDPKNNVTREAMAAFLFRNSEDSASFKAPKTSPFTDVKPGDKFYKEITWMAAKGISTGVKQANNTVKFMPKSSITREAMAAFMYRIDKDAKPALPKTSPFVDVKVGQKFYKEIVWMSQEGISTGIKQPSGKPAYAPKSSVTREAMAAFLYRAQ